MVSADNCHFVITDKHFEYCTYIQNTKYPDSKRIVKNMFLTGKSPKKQSNMKLILSQRSELMRRSATCC